MRNDDSRTRNNKLLLALNKFELNRLKPHLDTVNLQRGTILSNPDQVLDYAYFPVSCMISLVCVMEDGATTEIGLVGNEGMIGLPIILGGNSTISQAIVQISGECQKLPAHILKQEFDKGLTFQKLLLLHFQSRLTQISQSAACNRRHPINARLARWILSVSDCMQTNEIPLTQEIIAQMLGVRRAGVSNSARALQNLGIITYHRGNIVILDHEKLEQTACECYHLLKKESKRLLEIAQGRN